MSFSSDIKAQSDFATKILESINGLVGNSSSTKMAMLTQQTESRKFVDALSNVSVALNDINDTSNNILDMLKGLPENVFKGSNQAISSNAQEALDKATSTIGNSTQAVVDSANKINSLNTSTLANTLPNIENTNESLNNVAKSIDEKRGIIGWGTDKLIELKKTLSNLGSNLINSVLSTGKNLWIAIPKLILKLLWGGIKIISNIMGMFVRLAESIITLPIILATVAANIGGKLREDIVVTIGNAVQSTKNLFDHTSNIGSVMQATGDIAEESLRELADPASRMTKLFGEGASGAAAYIEAVKSTIAGMGHFGEIFALPLREKDSALFVIESMRGMKISYEQIGYYALEAGTSTDNIFDTLHNTHMAIKSAAEESNQDFVQVAIGFNKLRANIKDFGHLASSQVSNLVTRMRRLNVTAEELTGIFSKFTSYEEAASASAMLHQSFGMVVDALDIITAQDPGQIVNQFRDAMLATGRSFEDLSRHEKALMTQTTGLSAAALKTVMSYNSAHLSYDEMRKIASDTDPTKQQTKMMESLSGAITQIQKVMKKSNPFKAFAEGLKNNVLAQEELREITIELSEAMESLYRFGLNLDEGTISRITTPAIIILKKIESVLTGQNIENLFESGTVLLSTVAAGITNDIKPRVEKQISYLEETISAIDNTKQASIKPDILQNINSMLSKKEDVKNFLKANNLTSNGKLGREVTLAAIINSLKQATASATDPKGKKQIASITNDVYEMIDDAVKSTAGLDVIDLNRGMGKRIRETKEQLKGIYSKGSPMFKTLFDIGRKIMGGLIKGAIMGSTIVLKLLNNTLDDVWDTIDMPIAKYFKNVKGSNDSFTILNWLGISGDESSELKKQLGVALGKVFKKTGKISGMFLPMLGAILDVLGDVIDVVTSLVASGILQLMKNSWMAWMFFNKANVQSTQITSESKKIEKRLAAVSKLEEDKIETLNKVIMTTYKEYMQVLSGTPWGDYLNMMKSGLGASGDPNQYRMRALISTLNSINSDNNPSSYKNQNPKKQKSIRQTVIKSIKNRMGKFDTLMSFSWNLEEHYFKKLADAEANALRYIKVKDAVVKGKFNIITPTGLVIEPDSEDELELVAAKDGGILSTIYEKINKIYADTSESIKVLSAFNNNIRTDIQYEASDDLLNEFCDTVNDVINILANRKINATTTNIEYRGEI